VSDSLRSAPHGRRRVVVGGALVLGIAMLLVGAGVAEAAITQPPQPRHGPGG
jgi:hypothetical protein